ncbi:nuclear transport factor 2 family protein [Pseudoroseomonas globiformis]|uniref:Nuclear transport factor 2 family protein n=1 Tax=Teichococcus globiformis TaxID=2307229 RepID=A0ABV7G3H2_9PROT
MNLHPAIRTYFEAEKRNDGRSVIRTFASGAIVTDEGLTHAGRRAIDAWRHRTKSRYQHTMEPVDMVADGDVVQVRTRVAGQFPGSPAKFTYAFRLRKGRIVDLEIRG